MVGKVKIVLAVNDCSGKDAVVDNHVCDALCEYNSMQITRIVKNKLGFWHVTDYDYKVMLPDIAHCPHCGNKLPQS